ncbi:MAG TPA: NUDIX domain-containing protein [Chloroflexota bacterium]|jgi:8-oxo-dGTP pyrophosphatase MutT (NUDIX family)|nr:NUDIX domain-containing protein [Chloroflexota bacterium]
MGKPNVLLTALDAFEPGSDEEVRAVERIRRLAAQGDPWTRSSPLHATGSAVVVHPETRRVLLRWHERMRAWLQVGGHADPGESDPYDVALREAREETGLADLAPWPDATRPALVQVAIVPVPPGKGEPAHEHADLRYVLATAHPDAAAPESDAARLAWLGVEEALSSVTEDNLRVCLLRIADMLTRAGAG